MKTLEKITLIDDFMGLKPETKFDSFRCEFRRQYRGYEADWSELMRVVEKIETLGFDVKIQGISCSVNRLCENDTIISLVCGDRSQKIRLVYDVVINFILWYNQNKPS